MKDSKKPSWRSDINRAYSAGYKAGYNAHNEIPNRFGTRHSAMAGFSRALINARQNDKHIKNK